LFSLLGPPPPEDAPLVEVLLLLLLLLPHAPSASAASTAVLASAHARLAGPVMFSSSLNRDEIRGPIRKGSGQAGRS
jgi:hypothetical protein